MKIILSILLLFGFITSHANSGGPGNDKPGRLVAAELKAKVRASALREDYTQLGDYIKNGYAAYRITYHTAGADGKPVIASGALFVPDTNLALPLLNYNHGTYFPTQEQQAPSYLGYSYELIMGKLFAGAGYLVVMPDYIGYGASKEQYHPYGAYDFLAGSVIDMLEAVKEFCSTKNIRLSGKNFFSGWSEGAAVALATVKALEQERFDEFTPTATVLNAGPYYSSGFARQVVDAGKPLAHMNSYAWILQSYNRFYKINRPLSYYFKEPAASKLQKNGPEANIPREPGELFTDNFRDNFMSGKDSALQRAFVSNDLWDWKPSSTIVFCHGDKDDYVPLYNSEKAFREMKTRGADVRLRIFKGQNHSSGVLNFVQEAFQLFESDR